LSLGRRVEDQKISAPRSGGVDPEANTCTRHLLPAHIACDPNAVVTERSWSAPSSASGAVSGTVNWEDLDTAPEAHYDWQRF